MPATLRQLRAYALLLQERNFTRAAAAMHLSQPAFSALISGLEESLGVRLFDRSKRHVAPTVEGADFEGPARRALAEFDNAIAACTTARRCAAAGSRWRCLAGRRLAAGGAGAFAPAIRASRSRSPTCSRSHASGG
jgi:DNA-binding transcriptional LysR family regulator